MISIPRRSSLLRIMIRNARGCKGWNHTVRSYAVLFDSTKILQWPVNSRIIMAETIEGNDQEEWKRLTLDERKLLTKQNDEQAEHGRCREGGRR